MKYKKELDAESKIAKYKNLVGKYLYKAPNVYKKIVSIDRVSAGECWDVIHYTSVTVIYDINTPFAKIQLSIYGLIEDFEIEEHLTSILNIKTALLFTSFIIISTCVGIYHDRAVLGWLTFSIFLLIFAICYDIPTGYEQ